MSRRALKFKALENHQSSPEMARQKHTSSEWSELALIEAIKNQPILYDKALKDYRKSAPTELAWVAIAKEVNADGELQLGPKSSEIKL